MADVLLHQAVDGERWDTLALHYYGDALQYSRLVEANSHLDITPLLPAGAIVLIPVIDTTTSSGQLAAEDLPPWKR